MIFEASNYIDKEKINTNQCPWVIELIKYINLNFPEVNVCSKCKIPTFANEDSYISFDCSENDLAFHSPDNNALEVLKTLLPESKLETGSITINYNEKYALHAIKIAVNYVFNPNKVKYTNIKKAVFISRPNRFIANIEIDGEHQICHVKNTGRCRELLIPGATIYVKKHNNPNRKTNYSLISVLKGENLINIDSQVPNKAVHKWLIQNNLFEDIEYIKPEYRYNNSRIDFFIKTKTRRILLEVKGVTLEKNGIAMFPDAPTQRGINHINELIKAKNEGYDSYIFFAIQMNASRYFTPNDKTHAEFKDALINAKKAGVKILAYNCHVTKNSISISNKCPIVL